MDILTLSKLMGHTSVQVLNRYIKEAGDDLEIIARQSSPVDRSVVSGQVEVKVSDFAGCHYLS